MSCAGLISGFDFFDATLYSMSPSGPAMINEPAPAAVVAAASALAPTLGNAVPDVPPDDPPPHAAAAPIAAIDATTTNTRRNFIRPA